MPCPTITLALISRSPESVATHPLRGEQFCYFHQNAHRGVRRPPQSRLHPIALIEDEESIQYALMEVINALMRNTIDIKRATLILRALHIAVKNARRVLHDPVTKIPDYAAPTPEHEATAMQSELPAVSAIPYKPVEPTNPHFWEPTQKAEESWPANVWKRRIVWGRALSPVQRRRRRAPV
jgi:hypothetical protein